jgi:hypothetical protein
MPRPRTSDRLKPPMETRLRIARLHGQRRFPRLFESFREDAEQTVWMVAFSCRQKHLTTREFQRLCGRIWYAVARAYGFRRAYRSGNQKTGWYPSEEQYAGSEK